MRKGIIFLILGLVGLGAFKLRDYFHGQDVLSSPEVEESQSEFSDIDQQQLAEIELARLEQNEPSSERMPAATVDEVYARLRGVPFGGTLREYMDAIGVSRGTGGDTISNRENVGLNNSNGRLLRGNACFAELTGLFYDEIKIEDENWIRTRGDRRSSALNGRPALNESCNAATGCDPGFLWRKALEFANGDQTLAMQMIGVCGADDTANSIPGIPALRSDFNASRRGQTNFILVSSPARKGVADYLSRCPSQLSRMYLPGSLGARYDIPATLRNRIIQTQAPTQGGAVLPAKYYHTIGGAFASCLLTRRGVPGPMIRMAQRTGIQAYRSRSLCQSNLFQDDGSAGTLAESIRLANSTVGTHGGSAALRQSVQGENRLVTRMLRRNPHFNDIVNCRNIDIEGTTLSALRALTTRDCVDIPAELCTRALHRAQTWIVDYEWSMQQHLVGTQFAQDNCPNIGRRDPLANSCTALDHLIVSRTGRSAPPRAAGASGAGQ